MLSRAESKLSLEVEDLIHRVIGCALEVHRHLGCGFLETIYEKAMCLELSAQSIPFERNMPMDVVYKGQFLHAHRIDLIVDNRSIVELKAVSRIDPVHRARCLIFGRHEAPGRAGDQFQLRASQGWREASCSLNVKAGSAFS